MLEKIVIEAAIRDNKCAEGFAARMLKKKKADLHFFHFYRKGGRSLERWMKGQEEVEEEEG